MFVRVCVCFPECRFRRWSLIWLMWIISARDDPVITHMRIWPRTFPTIQLLLSVHKHTHYRTLSLRCSLNVKWKHKKRLWRTHWRWRNACLHRGFHRGSGLKLDFCPVSVCLCICSLFDKPSAWCLFYSSSWQHNRELPIKADTNTANQITSSETSANEEIRLSAVKMFMRI